VAGGAAQEEELLADVVHPSVVPDLKLTELRQLLREYGCPVSGNKAQLVDRLLQAMSASHKYEN
jgi:hypothetical protein